MEAEVGEAWREGVRWAWSDAGGRLCAGLLLAVPQTSGLFLVAHAHLLGDVHQRARHGQTCTQNSTQEVRGRSHLLVQVGKFVSTDWTITRKTKKN